MPRGRAAPGDPPHLPMGSPSSMESYGPQTSQTLTMCPRANRPPAVGCSGRVLEQPLERPLDRARAGAQAPIPKDAPPSRLAATEKRRKPSSNRQISQLLGGYLATDCLYVQKYKFQSCHINSACCDDQTRIDALITDLCSESADSNAFSRDSHLKLQAPWRAYYMVCRSGAPWRTVWL